MEYPQDIEIICKIPFTSCLLCRYKGHLSILRKYYNPFKDMTFWEILL